jgi:hopene-associated glycosyltransferase HpnB
MTAVLIALVSLAIWLYLLAGRGAFFRSAERDEWALKAPGAWPRVAIVVPARNEAEGIVQAVSSLLGQDYPGEWSLILVDDDSDDGTADLARQAATALGQGARLEIVSGQPLPSGWTGKLWAQQQGIATAEARPHPPDHLLLTDADIVYRSDVLTRLVIHAEADRLVLTSLMVELRCESFAERSLIPAFVFFFQMLYPFAWVNRPDKATAAAAGGCMLVRSDALRRAGGIAAIRNALIDDCALARLMKAQGPIWLGLTQRVRSIRRYPDIEEVRRMVARSAYAQLHYSPLLLIGTVAGMALTYMAPPLFTLFGSSTAQLIGFLAWVLMTVAFWPTLRLYRVSWLWAPALPAIAFGYMLFTLDSALQFARGKGGMWKGRIQATGT